MEITKYDPKDKEFKNLYKFANGYGAIIAKDSITKNQIEDLYEATIVIFTSDKTGIKADEDTFFKMLIDGTCLGLKKEEVQKVLSNIQSLPTRKE